jgi:heme o synthase
MSKNKFTSSFGVVLRLAKYQLSLMVAFSAMTGYLLTGRSLGSTSLILFMGVFLLAAGSSGLNQLQERHYDVLMERTKNRPLPSNQITGPAALAVSLSLIIAGGSLLGFLGLLSFTFGLLNVVLYNLIYTPLKRITWLAIVPGAFVGAITPLIGWTAGGNDVFHPLILYMAVFVLLWQLPHFWLILIRFRKDYERAGYSNPPASLNGLKMKNLIFIWVIVTSCFLFSFPLFGITFNLSFIVLLALVNLLLITLFHRFLFGRLVNQSLSNSFILINSFALIVFLVLIFGRQ